MEGIFAHGIFLYTTISMNMPRIVSLLCLVALTGCTSLFFQPAQEKFLDPSVLDLNYKETVLDDGDGPPLILWTLEPRNFYLGTILFLHGNAQNISTHIQSVAWLPEEGFRVVMVDYRGYGGSLGTPDISGIHQDAQRSVRFVRSKLHPNEPLVLYGQSLGASIALYTASVEEFKDTFSLVIAEAPFASYRQIMREKISSFLLLYPFQWPLGFLTDDAYSPKNIVSKIHSKVILVHGNNDEIVPPHHSEELCAALQDRCTRWIFPGAGHIDSFSHPSNRVKLIQALKEALR